VLWTAQGTMSTPMNTAYSQGMGFSDGEPVGYLRSFGGDFIGFKGTTPLPGGVPLGVGANGRILGFRMVAGGHTVAWSHAPAETLATPQSFLDAYAWHGNAKGVVVGYAANGTTPGTPTRAVRWEHGAPVVLPGKGGAHVAAAFAVNEGGVIVGSV